MLNTYGNHFIEKIINKDLKNQVYRKLRTRFPPEPNGYLHIGHAKSIYLNFYLAKKFNGYFYLRFDDTNPIKEKISYVKAIKKDLKWLGCMWDGTEKYTSSYFNYLYKYAIELINKGLAYVDKLKKNEIKKYRGTLIKPGINSPYRNQTIEENLLLFEKMKRGDFPEGNACLRAKIDMKSSFIIMRDPVLYRIIFSNHHQTRNAWCIYPTYDFAHCISDAIEHITHSLCTLEFQDNRRLYDWILNNISIKYRPKQYEFSKLNVEYSVLSKRKLKTIIEKKIVDNWDDPRLLTISGLKRRGYTPEAIKNFCMKIGVTKQENSVQLSLLESCIRSDLNVRAPRAMAILDPIKVIIYNMPDSQKEIITIPNHPNNKKMGTRKSIFSKEIYIDRSDFNEKPSKNNIKLSHGIFIRLRYAYVITVTKIKKNNFGKIICLICKYDKNTFRKNPINYRVSGVIHWIAKENVLNAIFNIYYPLFKIKKPDLEKTCLPFINNNSLVQKKGIVEKSIILNSKKNFYQFERVGYFCIDKDSLEKLQKKNHIITFNRIVTLKERKSNKLLKKQQH
ncbi:glutamine--tRNA ligase [Buchnera aphidicola]|uniref:Glutamine--tRNA ligase n=1 Tax=Buchnera aphidicola (Anoecia oenotherae) TaxID=1241833 RepID=A0A4D6XR07_9GAMM|nr:glutamine--tRNA ligase [Buchnera aphidicola]QCI19443.1 glutamine--tRNA ligase [Buchnera aphidicola (Anoecia oenotherae)]